MALPISVSGSSSASGQQQTSANSGFGNIYFGGSSTPTTQYLLIGAAVLVALVFLRKR